MWGGWNALTTVTAVVCTVCAIQLYIHHVSHGQQPAAGLGAVSPTTLRSDHDQTQIERHPYHRRLDENVPIDYENAIKATQQLMNLIWNRYELFDSIGRNFFLATNNMRNDVWDTIKYKFAVKILGGNSTFLMTFGGSSVTAGHDSYFNQSYPMIVHKRLGSILAMLGVNLDVHNIAQGANNCVPYSFCYESMGGYDPDFVNWEQSYNCGHDEYIFEMVGRYGGWSKNKALVYYSASGAWAPDKCPASKDTPPFSSEDWTPASAGLADWLPSWDDVKKEKEKLDEFAKAKPSSTRFSSFSKNPSYKGVKAHGFNVWEENPKCQYKDKSGKDATKCNGIDATQECAMRFMTHEASLYGAGNGAKWHPTRAFHMLRGEMIAWVYGLPLLDMLYELLEQSKEHSREELLAMYEGKLAELTPEMGKGNKCSSSLNCNARPQCFTDFKPHYTKNMTLTELLVGQPTNWTYDDAAYGEWSLTYGYLDAKPAYLGKGMDAGEIQFQVNVGQTESVWMCGNAGAHLHAVVKVDVNPTIPEDPTQYVPSENRVIWPHRIDKKFDCEEIHQLPQGRHVIALSANESHPLHVSSLTHIITWP